MPNFDFLLPGGHGPSLFFIISLFLQVAKSRKHWLW